VDADGIHNASQDQFLELESCSPIAPTLPIDEAETSVGRRFLGSSQASFRLPVLDICGTEIKAQGVRGELNLRRNSLRPKLRKVPRRSLSMAMSFDSSLRMGQRLGR
jgi:hypothetical protein